MQPEKTRAIDKRRPRRIEVFNKITSIGNNYICSLYIDFPAGMGAALPGCGPQAGGKILSLIVTEI